MDPVAALTSDPLPDAVADVLGKTAIERPRAARAVREPPGVDGKASTAWTITDRGRRWTLHNYDQALLVPSRRRGSLEPVAVGTGLDFAAVVADLDQAVLPPQLDAALRRLATLDPLEQALLTPARMGVIEPGSQWSIRYTLQTVVTTQFPDDRTGSVTLSTLEGEPVLSRQYSAAAVAATEEALTTRYAGGMLNGLLRGTDFANVEPLPASDRHLLTLPRAITLVVSYRPARLSIDALTYQSSQSAADLIASPQNRNRRAYEVLRSVDHPWLLPFDLALEETRAHLERAGYRRVQLQRLWLGGRATSSDEVTFESMGASPEEIDRIVIALADQALWAAWGMDVSAAGRVTLLDTAAGQHRVGTPMEVLAWASVLLQQSGLTLPELAELLQTRFVARTGRTDPSCSADWVPRRRDAAAHRGRDGLPGSGRPSPAVRDLVAPAGLGHRGRRRCADGARPALRADTPGSRGDQPGPAVVSSARRSPRRGHRLVRRDPDAFADGCPVRPTPRPRTSGCSSRPEPPTVADPRFALNSGGTRLAVEDPPLSGQPVLLADTFATLGEAFRASPRDLATLALGLPAVPTTALSR